MPAACLVTQGLGDVAVQASICGSATVPVQYLATLKCSVVVVVVHVLEGPVFKRAVTIWLDT